MTRLIDADALSKRLEELWNVHDDQDFANKDVWHELESAPTIDAVKHGRWKEVSDDMYAGGGAWICSSCHYGFSWKAYSLLPEEKYCPHCGARMDERKESCIQEQ